MVLIAKQRIKPGEQLGYDYGDHFFTDLQLAGQAIERKFFTQKGMVAKVPCGDVFNYELNLLIHDLEERPGLQLLKSLLSSAVSSSAIENYRFLKEMFFTKQETAGKLILASLPLKELADTLKQKFKLLMTAFSTQHSAAQSAPAAAAAAPAPETERSHTRPSRR